MLYLKKWNDKIINFRDDSANNGGCVCPSKRVWFPQITTPPFQGKPWWYPCPMMKTKEIVTFYHQRQTRPSWKRTHGVIIYVKVIHKIHWTSMNMILEHWHRLVLMSYVYIYIYIYIYIQLYTYDQCNPQDMKISVFDLSSGP